MPIEVGYAKFPGTAEEMLADRLLSKIFMSYLIKSQNRVAANKLLFLDENPQGFKIYTNFLSPNAKTRIPLDGQLEQAKDKIMAGPNDAAASKLDVMARALRSDFGKDIGRAMNAFYNTVEDKGSAFHKHFRKIAEKKIEGRFGKIKVVTERLGLNDEALVKEMMISWYMSNDKDAYKFAKAAIKKAGIKASSQAVVVAMFDQKGLVNDNFVKIDAKKLAICGFENVNDKKIVALLKEMAALYFEQKKSKAAKVFDKVKKLEPKTSPIAKLKFDGMIKLLEAKGAMG